MNTIFRALLLAAASLLPALGLAATVTLNPVADAYVRNGSNYLAKNFGTATTIRAQSSSTAAQNYQTYLKFDTATASGQVTSATLRVYAKIATSGSITSTAYGVADTTWSETGITWNTKPVPGSALGSIIVTSTGYSWKDIDVTAYIQSERNAGRNVVSFAYISAVSSVLTTMQSREGANKPQFVIVTAPPNVAPTVSMTAPADGSTYVAPASITLSANTADSDGSIAAVEFYNGATLIGSVAAPPYTYTWDSVAEGSYSLHARAIDNLGAATDSDAVTVNVSAAATSGVFYIYADHLNTPRVITDSSSKEVWRWDSDAFGTDAANEDPDGDGQKFRYNLRFPGQYFDRETGLHYNYFRDYEPGTGRYVQSDPIGLVGGLNVYAYVDGNPLSLIDPEGLAACLVMFPDMPIDTGFGFTSSSLDGHGGVLTYDTKGVTQYHEYGRYPSSQAIGVGLTSDEGNIRRVTIPNLKIGSDGRPTPASLDALRKSLEKKAGKGTDANLTCDANADENKIRDYIKKLSENAKRPKYSWKPWNSNQCRDFANRAFNTGR